MAKQGMVVWAFDEAPEQYKKLSTNGGDEDWVLFIPAVYGESYWPWWAEEGGRFGCCGVDEYKMDTGRILIGYHS